MECYIVTSTAPEIDVQSSSDPFTIDKIELVRPPHIDQRLIVQQSVFTAESPAFTEKHNQSAGFSQWYVSCSGRIAIRHELSRLGIMESTVFPGLEILAVQIKQELISSIGRP